MKQPRRPRSAKTTEAAVAVPAVMLAATALMFLFAFLGAAFAVQAMQNLSSARAIEASQTAATAAAAKVGEHVADVARKLDGLAAGITTLDAATLTSRKSAGTRLSAAYGEDAVIEIYAPGIPVLDAADFSRFGFTRAAVLSEARDMEGRAPVQVRRSNQDWRLVQARPILRDGRLLAILYADLPLSEVSAGISGLTTAGSRLELRQEQVHGGNLVVAATGPSADLKESLSVPVADSQLAVAGLHESSFQVADVMPALKDRSALSLWIWTAVLAAAAFAAFRVRRVHQLRRARVEDLSGLEVMPADVHAVRAPGVDGQHDAVKAKAAAAASRDAQDQTDADAATASGDPASRPFATQVERSIFRAYDIRGVMGSTLSADVARVIGAAIGSEARARGLREMVVGRDGRLSGPELVEALIRGLRESGCDVIDIGLVPTPVLYFATYHLNAGSGVMLTGSHNPPDHNGFKIVLGGETLSGEAIQSLYARIVESRLATGSGGLQEIDVRRDYIDRISSDIQVERKLRVVVDAGNGAAGEVGPAVLEAIGCDVVALNCEIDGNFPNHHPDPSDPANMQDLIVSVRQFDADIGIAFDGDGDRLGVVTADGDIINPDRLLMLFARDVLGRVPGGAVIYDVKCTNKLHEVILGHGGSPIMWKTGHSLIKAKMREEDAELAGEMSGHFFFRERWYGFDDGIYAGARLAEIIAGGDRPAVEVFAELPNAVSTPEIKVPMEEGRTHRFVESFARRATFEDARMTTLDGIRADWPDGWGLVRSSNTTSVLVMRFEADSAAALIRIQEHFRKQLLAVDPKLRLPF